MRLLAYLKEIFYPKRCDFCGKKADSSFSVCNECLKNLPKSFSKPIFPIAAKNNSRFYLKCVMAPFFYTAMIKTAIRALKFKGRVSAAVPLASFMSDIVISSYYYRDIDFLVSVPISKKRLKKRMYNQSELLARELSRLVSVPFEKDIVVRSIHRPPQASITSKEKRLENVKGVFSVTDRERVLGKRILLVDDVLTTGSTMNECAKALKKAGALEVLGITAAKAVR